jgi:hypothetical protein
LLHNAHLAGQIAVELATATPASGREGAL